MAHSDEYVPPTSVAPCSHVWVRRGLGTGTSEGTTLWGATTCIYCGMTHPAASQEPTMASDEYVPDVGIFICPVCEAVIEGDNPCPRRGLKQHGPAPLSASSPLSDEGEK